MQVTIAERFNGPPGVGNGGYVCGLVAAELGSPRVQVSLFLPAPLGIPLTLQRTLPGPVRLLHHEAVVAEGHAFTGESRGAAVAIARGGGAKPRSASTSTTRFRPVSCAARNARTACGSFPGRRRRRLACTWRPPDADPVYVWAALDCPSGFACMPPGSLSVLASMTARIHAPAQVGEEHVISAWKISSEGRKHRGGSAIHDAGGRLVAVAEALWITPRSSNPLGA